MSINPKEYRAGVEMPAAGIGEDCLVRFSEPRVVKGSMFTAAYAEFTLTTEPNGWQVERRFEDFVWLRNVLSTLHPDLLVPILPKEVNQGAL
jgi:hypothetical protein